MTQVPKMFYIRNKITHDLFVASSGKKSWVSMGAAKNAFNLSVKGTFNTTRYNLSQITYVNYRGDVSKRSPKFDEQNVYEIVEPHKEGQELLDEAINLLTRTAMTGSLPEMLVEDIRTFTDSYYESRNNVRN